MDMTTELAKPDDATATLPVVAQPAAIQQAPRDLYRIATDVAGICREIVTKTAKMIQRRKYVCIEGWQAIATAHGCCLSIDQVSEDDAGNVTSIASVRRMADGAVLAHAEGFVGMDEPRWKGGPRYARRAMSQTRAMSRAARAVFAHVVVLIDSGLSTTPAEEVPDDGFEHQAVPARKQVDSKVHAVPGAGMTVEESAQYHERIDRAFQSRGFDPDGADAALAAVFKKHKVANLKGAGKEWCEKLITAIESGQLDKMKPVAAESAA